MYENQGIGQVSGTALGGLVQTRNPDVTIGQNIDAQIVMAEKRLDELKKIKERLESTGLMDTRIDDLRQAMNW